MQCKCILKIIMPNLLEHAYGILKPAMLHAMLPVQDLLIGSAPF